MRRRQPLPKIWLMTDERGGDVLAAVAQLPRGAGIVFRHYATPSRERRALFDRVRCQARRKGHVILLAGSPVQARSWGADGAHNRSRLASRGLRTMAVHSARERVLATAMAADLIFVSPVFATRSHPDSRLLGVAKLGLIAARARPRTVALGGLSPARFKRFNGMEIYGWAGIDAFRT